MSIEASTTPAPTTDAPAGRAELLAELEGMPADDAAPVEDAPAEVKPADPVTSEDEEAEADEPVKAADPAPDVELNKRLEAIQKAERRAKEDIAKQRAELEAERKRLDPDLAELNELRELRRRAKLGDSAALLKFGEYGDDDAELVARSVYALSKAAAANPQAKEAAARALREREAGGKLSALEQKLADLEKQLAERDQKAATERQVASYLDATAKVVDDSTPIVRQMFTKSPDKARQQVAAARDYLMQQTGEEPEPADVLKALEDYERSELIARGFDPDSLLKTTKQTTPAAGEKNSAKTLSSELTKSTSPRTAPLDPAEERAALLRALESGQVD